MVRRNTRKDSQSGSALLPEVHRTGSADPETGTGEPRATALPKVKRKRLRGNENRLTDKEKALIQRFLLSVLEKAEAGFQAARKVHDLAPDLEGVSGQAVYWSNVVSGICWAAQQSEYRQDWIIQFREEQNPCPDPPSPAAE